MLQTWTFLPLLLLTLLAAASSQAGGMRAAEAVPTGRLAFVRSGAIFVQSLDGTPARLLWAPDSREGAWAPRWSPDGRMLAVEAPDGKLWLIEVDTVLRRPLTS